MRVPVVFHLWCAAAVGSLFAADVVPEEAAKRTDEKAAAPLSSPAADTAERLAAIDGVAAGAVLGLLQITAEEKTDDKSAKRFTLHIPIKARPHSKIDPHELAIHVLFFDILNGQNVAQTSANVSSRWLTAPADWVDSDTEELAVEYRLPAPEPGTREERRYFGYVVRIYYQQQLQAATSDPERLAQENPAPRTLPAPSGERATVPPAPVEGAAVAPHPDSKDFANYALKLRESALLKMEPKILIPTSSRIFGGKYPWKTGIVTTVFYVGTTEKGKPNRSASVWNPHWTESFGGVDNPDPGGRKGYVPADFIPRQNPFYIALPYNDVTHGATKPEAPSVIPWFKEAYTEPGKSVCRDRWIAIRNSAGKVCYAQWSDCGPFLMDHYQYVFGNDRPRPNSNQGAGLEVSPAVRDYLGLANTDVTDWKFVDFHEVQSGPWTVYGENNPFVLQLRRRQEQPIDGPSTPPNAAFSAPSVEEPPIRPPL